MAGSEWSEQAEGMARRIKRGENGKLFKTLLRMYKGYFVKLCRRFRSEYIREMDFDELSRSAVDDGIRKWDEERQLIWVMHRAFRDLWRRHARVYFSRARVRYFEPTDVVIRRHSRETQHPAQQVDTKLLARLVLEEMAAEKSPSREVLFERGHLGADYASIAMLLGLSTEKCIKYFYDNRKAVMRRLRRKHPKVFGKHGEREP
jgi:capsule polysaccharide modification protein KpsS